MKEEKNSMMKKIARQYSCKLPCSGCPFRADKTGVTGLSERRLSDVIEGISSGEQGTFHCHKTIDRNVSDDYEDELDLDQVYSDDAIGEVLNRKHCAGAMAATIMHRGLPLVVRMGVIHQMIKPDHYDEAKSLILTPEYILSNNL